MLNGAVACNGMSRHYGAIARRSDPLTRPEFFARREPAPFDAS
jgi:hypothetical protein